MMGSHTTSLVTVHQAVLVHTWQVQLPVGELLHAFVTMGGRQSVCLQHPANRCNTGASLPLMPVINYSVVQLTDFQETATVPTRQSCPNPGLKLLAAVSDMRGQKLNPAT